ncbi:MAG: hypothetical protein PVG14_17635 [Anaerolineales bacterium]|jgi:hypothetical protein
MSLLRKDARKNTVPDRLELLERRIETLEERAATGIELPSFGIGARVYNSADQTHNSSGNWYTLTFDSERRDDGNLHDSVSNNSRLTAPIAGWYIIVGRFAFASNGTGTRRARIRVNQVANYGQSETISAVSGDWTWVNVDTVMYLSAGDYVELQGWQDSGGNLNIKYGPAATAEFAMARLA